MDSIILLSYIAIWGIILYRYKKKKKAYDVGFFIVSLYFALSICSYYAFQTSDDIRLKDFSILPFLFLLLLILITISPILKFDNRLIIYNITPNYQFVKILAWFCIIPNMLSLPDTISGLLEGFTRMMIDVSAGGELYQENRYLAESTGYDIHNLASVMSTAFSGMTCLLAFYYPTIKKKSLTIEILLFVSCFKLALGSVSQGTRGSVIEFSLVMIVSYLLLQNQMSAKIQSVIKYIGLLFLGIVTIIFIALTIGRFGSTDSGALNSTFYYSGQQNLYFNKYALDDNGIRYGDRTIPLFKRIIGLYDVPHNYMERRAKYPHLKVNDEVFVGYVGDIMIDFGPFIGVVLLVLQTIFVLRNTKIRRGRIYFHQILLLHFTLYLVSLGAVKLYPFSDVGGNLQIIVYGFAYVISYYDYTNKLYKENIKWKISQDLQS